MFVIVRHAGHDERAGGAERVSQCGNQASWSVLNRGDLRERRVDDEDVSTVNARCNEVLGHVLRVDRSKCH